MRLFGNAVQNIYGALSVTAPAGYTALTLNASNSSALTAIGLVGFVSPSSGNALQVVNNGQTITFFAINSNGNVTVNSPTTGQALTITGASAAYTLVVNGNTSTGNAYGVAINGGSNASDTTINVNNAASTSQYFNIRGDGSVSIGGATQNGPGCLSILKSLTAASTTQSVQHALLSSYQAVPGTGAFLSNAYLYVGGSGGNYLAFGQNPNTSSDPYAQWIQSGFNSASPTYYDIALNPVGGNVTIGSSSTSSGLLLNGNPIYAGIPINSQSGNYTTVLGDANKCIKETSSSTTVTIAANSSVSYPLGTAISFANRAGSGNVTIAINSDTLVWAQNGATGSRTLASNGVATAIKTDPTLWIISGSGLT